jgi:hypothetical protein
LGCVDNAIGTQVGLAGRGRGCGGGLRRVAASACARMMTDPDLSEKATKRLLSSQVAAKTAER